MLRMENSNMCLEPQRTHIHTKVDREYPNGYAIYRPMHLVPCHHRQYNTNFETNTKTIQFSI